MRILFVVPRFHTNQYQMVKTLQEKKHDVFFHVAVIGNTEDHTLLTPIRYKQSKASIFIERILGSGGVNKKFYFPRLVKYWKEFAKLRPEVVIIRDPYKSFSILAAFYSLFTKSKIIFYTQEELFKLRRNTTIFKQKLLLFFFNAAWMTPITGNEYGKYSKLKYMYYVPLPVPLRATIRLSKNISDEGPKILMIGKYHQERKKHLLFLNAIRILKHKFKFKVTIAGECVKEQQLIRFNAIKEAIDNMGLSDIVYLKKNIPFSKMEELYTSHHVFVLPAINEQYGVSVIEALGYGLPVICTDTCGARFNIRDGETGFVIKSDSLDELTTALEGLIFNKERISHMSENSFQYATKYLSGRAFYASFINMINDRFYLQHPN